jgi:hypothetical protein
MEKEREMKSPEMQIRQTTHLTNEEASAGGLAGIFILFVVCSIFIAFLGPVVDMLGVTNNAMITAGMPMSQDRVNTMFYLTSGFAIMAFLILLAAGINYWIVSIQSQSSEV